MTKRAIITCLIAIMLIAASLTACVPITTDKPVATPTPKATSTPEASPSPTASPTPEPSPTPVKEAFKYDPYYLPQYGKDFLGENFEDWKRITEALYQGDTEVQLTTIETEKEFEHIRRAVLSFFIPTNLLHDYWYLQNEGPFVFDTKTKVVTIRYNDEKEVYLKNLNHFFDKIESIINEHVSDIDDTFKTAEELYRYVVNSMTYLSDHRLNAYDAFMSNKGFCQTYSEMYQHLLWQAGIECYLIGNGTHEWNLIKLDGEFYHVDTTWAEKDNPLFNFCMSDKKCYAEHDPNVRVCDSLLDGKLDFECPNTQYDGYYIQDSQDE